MSYKDRKADIIDHLKKIMFFITAFIPLWAILIINYSFTENPNWCIVIGLIIFLIVITFRMMNYLKKKQNAVSELSHFKVVKELEITHEIIYYIIGFIPVLLIDKFELPEIFTFIIILLTIYGLYAKTNMLHMNVIIAIKYKIYRVIDDHDNNVVVFSRLTINKGVEIPYSEIIPNVNMVINTEN